MYKGSCLCGSVKYEFAPDPDDYGCCHCSSCRKASGTAFGANIPVRAEDLVITDGESMIKKYESSSNKFRCFCSNCGSPLFAHLGEEPEVFRIRLGSLDTEFSKKPSCHFFAGEKADWYEISDSIKQFAEWPEKEFLVLHGSKHEST